MTIINVGKRRTHAKPDTVLVRNLKRFGAEAAARLRAVGQREGRFLRVPTALYESVWTRRGRLGDIPADYDPEKHKDVGRCCS